MAADDLVTPREMGVLTTRVNDLRDAFGEWLKRQEAEDRRFLDWQKEVEGHFSRLTHEMQRFTDTIADQISQAKENAAKIVVLEGRVEILEKDKQQKSAVKEWVDASWKTVGSVAAFLYVLLQFANTLHNWRIIP